MVGVFKTNIDDLAMAGHIAKQLQLKLPKAEINFDLEDCDKILRIDHHCDIRSVVIKRMNEFGFFCAELE